jgi:hypothetical protein
MCETNTILFNMWCRSAFRAYTAASQDSLNLLSKKPWVSNRKPSTIGLAAKESTTLGSEHLGSEAVEPPLVLNP